MSHGRNLAVHARNCPSHLQITYEVASYAFEIGEEVAFHKGSPTDFGHSVAEVVRSLDIVG